MAELEVDICRAVHPYEWLGPRRREGACLDCLKAADAAAEHLQAQVMTERRRSRRYRLAWLSARVDRVALLHYARAIDQDRVGRHLSNLANLVGPK